MIIKVMTRKEPSFRQLLAYVTKDAADRRYVLTHNLIDSNLDAIATAFEGNARLLRKHANGTVMFHDIVSVTRANGLGLERQKEILKEIARDYITRRAPNHLVYAGLHEDQPHHLHYHFVISANPHGEWRRAHLSKPELRQLQTEMEARVLRLYPELQQTPAMSRKTKSAKLTQPGQELRRRTGKVPERERVSDALTRAFAMAQDRDHLFQLLTDQRLELYRRGKTVGVRDLDAGRNHRLATLGLTDAFKTLSKRIETAEQSRLVQHHAAHAPAPQQSSEIAQAAAQTSLKTSAPSASNLPQPVAQTPPPQASAAKPTSDQEEPVNIFELAINGVMAVADALTIAPRSVKPVNAHVNSVKTRVGKIIKRTQQQKPPAQTASPAQATHAQVPSPRAVPIETKAVRHAVNNAIDPDLTQDQVKVLNDVRQTMPPNEVQVLNDVRQALIEERVRDIAEARQEQAKHGDERGNSLKR